MVDTGFSDHVSTDVVSGRNAEPVHKKMYYSPGLDALIFMTLGKALIFIFIFFE